jgi:hypothetical protein
MVVTAAEAHAAACQQDGPRGPGLAPRVAPLRDEGAARCGRPATLQDEFHGLRRWRPTLDAALLQLLVAVALLRADAPATAPRARTGACGVYRSPVEPATATTVGGGLRAALAITPTQLNRVCRRALGRSAPRCCMRPVLEAQLELAMSIADRHRPGVCRRCLLHTLLPARHRPHAWRGGSGGDRPADAAGQQRCARS